MDVAKSIEEYSLNAWPALQTLVQDGWLLRFADGYTKRSNSVQAIYNDSTEHLNDKIDQCEQLYANAGLNTIFKITPFVPDGLDEVLEKRGYQLLDLTSVRIRSSLKYLEEPRCKDILVQDSASDIWLNIAAEFTELSPKNKLITKQLLSGSALQKGFFVQYDESRPVACGFGVIQQNWFGIYDIATAKHFRNQGYGEQLVLNMLTWARDAGATSSYLMVVQNNAPACRLYDKLNYKEIYTYWYRSRKA